MVVSAAAYKEGDEASEVLFGETKDEAEDNAGSDESPLRWLRRRPTAPTTRQRTPPAPPRPRGANNEVETLPAPPRPRPTNNEAEDIAGSAEAPPCQQRGGGFPPLR